MKEKKYVAEKIENFQAEIPVEEYMKECVDVATFLEFCKECSNYGKLWCCPPYTFDVEKDYWNKYRKIQIMGRKLYLPKELTSQSYIKNEQWKITEEFLLPLSGKPCRFQDKMRYSIESLGGNVGKTVTKYLKQELQWVEEGKLPEYFMLIYGLLIP